MFFESIYNGALLYMAMYVRETAQHSSAGLFASLKLRVRAELLPGG